MRGGIGQTFKGYIAAQGRRALQKDRPQLPVVTISRETGAGAVTLARRLAQELDKRGTDPNDPPWTVFNRKLVERVLEDHELPSTLERFMPEDVTSNLKDAVEQQLGLHPANWTLVQHTTDTILCLAHLGHVVLVGRGANVITANVPRSLHVRLVAPLGARIRHIEEFYEMSQKEAIEYIRTTDRARTRYVKRYFHSDTNDPHEYDLLINTARTGFDKAVKIIADATSAVALGN